MRWHVQGTDALTGRDVELAVNDQDSAQAVQAAIERHIVVSHVRPGPSSTPRLLMPLTLALVIALAAVATGLYINNQSLRGTLDQALAEQSRLANSVSLAQKTAANLRDSGTLAQSASTQISQLADQLTAARSRMSLTEQQLTAAHDQVSNLAIAAQQVPALQSQLLNLQTQLASAQQQLQASQALATRLRTDLDLQSRRLEALQNAPNTPVVKSVPDPATAGRLADLQKANAALSAQIDELKSELLVLAATPAPTPASAPVEPPPPASNRWALRVPFQTAQTFLVFNADDNQISAIPIPPAPDSPEPLLTLTALNAAHALKCTLLTDRPRERIYTATLSLSLAADAPPAILSDNKTVIADFLRAFAPTLKDPAPILAAAAQLAGQDSTHRQQFLTEDTTVTLWNDKTGIYTLKVESSHAP